MIPNVGELWELTETQKATVGNQIASFLLSAPALVVAECPDDEPGSGGGFYEVLWAGEIRAIPFGELPWIRFGERLGQVAYLPGDLLRVASVPDQPPWARALRGQVALVVEAQAWQRNWRYYALVLGQIHLFHPLDLERIE